MPTGAVTYGQVTHCIVTLFWLCLPDLSKVLSFLLTVTVLSTNFGHCLAAH